MSPWTDAPAPRRRPHLFGVPIRIDLSWVLAAFLIGGSLVSGAFPQLYAGLAHRSYVAMAVIAVAGLGLSILLHELAHTLVGRRFGVRIERITLFFFGGVAEMSLPPRTALGELSMAIAGPVFSFLFGLALAALAGGLQATQAGPVWVNAISYLAALNLMLAVFNMTPAFPLDGGRVLRAVLWLIVRRKAVATDIALKISGLIALLVALSGVALVVRGEVVGGLWWILMAFFLRSAGAAEREAARDETASGG